MAKKPKYKVGDTVWFWSYKAEEAVSALVVAMPHALVNPLSQEKNVIYSYTILHDESVERKNEYFLARRKDLVKRPPTFVLSGMTYTQNSTLYFSKIDEVVPMNIPDFSTSVVEYDKKPKE